MKISCDICDTEIDVQICCSGHECGCMGMPVEPPVCSEKCYDKYMNNRKKDKTTPIDNPGLIQEIYKHFNL